VNRVLRRQISYCLISLILLITCSCATTKVVYKDVPDNTIVLKQNGVTWTYPVSEWMIIKRDTFKQTLDTLTEKDQQLRECLERERKN